ncbi:MAG TPA: ferritin-like domain-containing protein [bacterium]|nr:ferritin-like domain-containing protein [bacterium]
MTDFKQELISMLNRGLELEHAARIQYLSHAELIKGEDGEKIIERLQEIAGDEKNHEDKFRNLIGNYLGGEPVMTLAETHRAENRKKILEVNLKGERDAIEFYKKIYARAAENKQELSDLYETLEHEIRHIIIDEQEHVAELSLLLGI